MKFLFTVMVKMAKTLNSNSMYALNATSQVFIVISFESIRNKNMEKKNLHLVTQILTWKMKPGKAAAIVSSLIM